MTTANSLKAHVNKVGYLTIDGLLVPVTIQDAKNSYGQVRYLVAPLYAHAVRGMEVPYSATWVAAGRVTVNPKEE